VAAAPVVDGWVSLIQVAAVAVAAIEVIHGTLPAVAKVITEALVVVVSL
jgi:hypothetical protein